MSLGQLQDKTFILSGVAALNNDRPWGMQVAGDGKLPVSGLAQKMAANIPKGEMEVYKAAGLEEWLKARGKVSREELQQWMMENGPELEVKELRPLSTVKTDYDVWMAERARLMHEAETAGVNAMEPSYPRIGPVTIMLDEGQPIGRMRDHEGVYQTVPVDGLPGLEQATALLRHAESWTPEFQARVEAQQKAAKGSDDATIGKYGVEPRPVEQMEGPVELLVRVPTEFKRHVDNYITERTNKGFQIRSAGGSKYLDHVFPTYQAAEDWLKAQVGPLWTGGHHGDSGQNTVGFAGPTSRRCPMGVGCCIYSKSKVIGGRRDAVVKMKSKLSWQVPR
jgi:hypothetical protein